MVQYSNSSYLKFTSSLFEAIQGGTQLIYLMVYHSRKSCIRTKFSQFYIALMWFLTIYNVLFAAIDVIEEYANPKHVFPILDSFGVSISVAYRLCIFIIFFIF
jgi:hypothetical protein